MRLLVVVACMGAFSLGFLLERAALVSARPTASHCVQAPTVIGSKHEVARSIHRRSDAVRCRSGDRFANLRR